MTTPSPELVEMALRAYTNDCTCSSCRKAVTRILTAITPVIRAEAMEEAANIIKQYGITHSPNGQHLTHRHKGDRSGLAYAAAIRALVKEGEG